MTKFSCTVKKRKVSKGGKFTYSPKRNELEAKAKMEICAYCEEKFEQYRTDGVVTRKMKIGISMWFQSKCGYTMKLSTLDKILRKGRKHWKGKFFLFFFPLSIFHLLFFLGL